MVLLLTSSFAFVEYEDVESANNAQSRLNNLKLDDTHTFIANMLDDIRDSESYKSEYVPPEDKDTPFESMEGMYDWLLDDRGRDQFFVRYGDTTEINWSGVGGSAPTHEYSKQVILYIFLFDIHSLAEMVRFAHTMVPQGNVFGFVACTWYRSLGRKNLAQASTLPP